MAFRGLLMTIPCLYLPDPCCASSGSQAAVGLFRWIGRSPRLINDKVIVYEEEVVVASGQWPVDVVRTEETEESLFCVLCPVRVKWICA